MNSTMKANILTTTLRPLGAAILMLACVANDAFAGSRPVLSRSVTITSNADGSGSAVAYLGGVYNGTGVIEGIGCGKLEDSGYFFCHMVNEARVLKTCYQPNSSFLAQSFSTFSSDAKVRIAWNSAGRCTTIEVTHSSEYEDKQN
jgi:hypothetical protein